MPIQAAQDWKTKLSRADDIDDISEVFRQLFQEALPPSNSPFFKDTFSSVVVSLEKLIPREAPDPDRVKRALGYMAAAKTGTGDKRAPIRVLDMGNGKFKVLDGNTSLQALLELGETEAVVEIKKSLKQQVSDQKSIDAVYEQADKALPVFKEWVEAYAKKTGGRVMLRPGLKGKERAIQKVASDYAGNASRLTDIIGGTLLFETVEQVAAAYRMIAPDPAVYKAKNRYEKPTDDGYRDIMMVVSVGGHLCELQLNTQAMLDAKEKGLGHKFYELTRQLEPVAKDEATNGDMSYIAKGYIDAIRKLSIKLYRNAAISSDISSASSMASDSEIDDEFKRILQRLSESSISVHLSGSLASMRKMEPDNFSIAKGTSSFSTKSKISDFIAVNPPFDTENITRNGNNVNAKVVAGRRTRAYLNDDTELALQYVVIEAKDLVSSHNFDFSLNPEFPVELQPRDRTRDSMKGQISSISNNLNPDRLGGSLYASVGAPIVGRDLVVESGNGRTMGIKQRYNKDGATEYKAWISANAKKFGIDAGKLAGIDQPVLVRIRLSGGDRKTITERANESDIASMSPMEQAKVDDRRLTASDMESFSPSKEGDITAASNAGFIQRFIEKVGKAESAGLLTADSRPTKALVDRIQCAIFSKAYADDRILTLMAEETHPAVKNILTALTAAAPVFAKIRASYPDMGGINIVNTIIDATRLMLQSRDDGESIETVLSQMGLFSQIPEETKAVTRILNDNIRRSKHLGTVFKLAGEKILSFLQNQNQVGLFGKETPPTASEIISGAVARAAEMDPANKRKGIFEDTGIILEKAGIGPYADSIRSAKTFMDIARVFQQEFGIVDIPGQEPPETETDYQDENTPYGLRAKGIKTREKLNQAAKEILARVNKPEDLTAEDKDVLKQYSGRGGLTENSQFEYYTPAYVAEGIWDSLKAHGFENGNVMDPCTGAGVFSGTKPAGVVVTGCDIDPVGSKVASLLNPGDKITNQSFEEVVMATPDNSVDSFVGNVPFGSARGKSAHLDSEYSKEKRIERYFILRALDKIKPGGLCCFVVPINIVGARDSAWQKFRIAVSKKAEFLGAHKLPSKTFRNQGTDTVTDIIVLKKHPKDLLDRIPDLPFEALKQTLVVWDEFVSGMYWQGEGRPFIMGKYVPKVDGDRWSREVVDGDIDSTVIKAKLAQKFNSRINWDALEIAEPVIRNFIEGDRREINGLEYELVAGEWRKVNIAADDETTMDVEKYGAKNQGELKDILSDNKTTLRLTASQIWSIRKAFPDMLTELQKQSIEFAMSQPNDTLCEQLFRGSIIGGMIGRYREAALEGVAEATELSMLQDMVVAEIGKYGHPKNNKSLNLTGESSRMFGLFMNAIDEKGNFSDLLAGNINDAGNTLQFDSTNPQSIIEHLFVREGILNIEIEDVNRLYSGSLPLTLSEIASFDAIAITPEKMLMPLGRYCSGDIYPKMTAMADAMLNEDDEKIKTKWQKQIAEINRKRIRTNPEDISFGLRQKWFSPEYVVKFLKENGYPNVEYGSKVDVEVGDDAVTGRPRVVRKFHADYDNPFGEFVGIGGNGFPRQFLSYLNGGNVTSSGDNAQERIAAYKNQCRAIEENFNVWMKQRLEIDQIGELYNMKFNGMLLEDHSGDPLGLKGVSPQVRLHDYQNAAIRRMSEEGRGCLGFDVGLGKTLSALGLCQYNLQMGRSKRSCIVVPDSVLVNWYHSANQFFGHMNDVLMVGYEVATGKDGQIEREPVLDETGNHKKNKHTGEFEFQDKLIRRNSKEDVFAKMWEIPMTSKKIIIMSKEKFAMIPMMPETKGAYVKKMTDKALISMANAAAAIKENSAGVKTGTSYADDVKLTALEQQYSDEGTKKKGELPYYEMMGFTDVMVDEAHLFKNSFQGGENTSQIAYLPTAPSAKRALDMNMKMNFLRDSNNGRGAYLLTATPVTNSPFEIYNMLSLLCPPEEFERFGVYTIDDFVRVFGEIVPVDKVRVDGSLVSKDGLIGFQNLGGLRSIFHKYVNMKDAKDVNLALPPHEEIHDDVELSDEQKDLYDILREKATDAAKPGKKAREDTMFAVIRDMDRVTTDMDLYRKQMTFIFSLSDQDNVNALMSQVPKMMKIKSVNEETGEKIEYERELVYETKTEGDKFVLIVPEEYEVHVVTRLHKNGIKESSVTHPLMPKYAKLVANMQKELETGGKQLVFTEEKSQHEKIMRIMVHNLPMISDKIGIINAETASGGSLQGISDSYNSGKLAVVICNKKAEVGVNLQKGTTAIHHLTLPWTPASIQQRNGRGIRQGNTAKHINVYYYLGKGSFDVYRLDLLQRKADWMKELFNGKSETAANANADNADDMMDLLAANPEEAKQRRLEKLEAKKLADKEREDKRLINQLQILAAASRALSNIDSDKQGEFEKLNSDIFTQEAKIRDFKKNAINASEEDRTKLGEKIITAQRALDSLNSRLSKLNEKYETKRQNLDARVKQISGVLRGTAKKGTLPFSETLIDKPSECLVSLSGQVVAIGDLLQDKNYTDRISRIIEIDDGSIMKDGIKRARLLSIYSDNTYSARNELLDSLYSKYTKVSYSESEIDEMRLLAKEHKYADLLSYTKEFFLKHEDRIKFSLYDPIPYELPDGTLGFSSPMHKSDGSRVLFPEPKNDDWRKRFCMFVLKERGRVGGTLLRSIFGDNYSEIVSSYGSNATETEILTACASVYNEWVNPLIAENMPASEIKIRLIRSGFVSNVGDMMDQFDNFNDISLGAKNYMTQKLEELRSTAEAEKAEEERKAIEALKDNPDFKEIPQEVMDAFAKIGITVRVNHGIMNLRVSRFKTENYKPFSRWFFQDKHGMSGQLYKSKEVLKARYGAKFFKDEGNFKGAWWHVPSSTDLKAVFGIIN